MKTDTRSQTLSRIMIGLILLCGLIIAYIQIGGFSTEMIGYGIGSVFMPLIGHIYVMKGMGEEWSKNRILIIRAGILDAILLAISFLVMFQS